MTRSSDGGHDRKQLTRTKATPAEKQARIERIVGMMRTGAWVRGVSGDALAAEWGLDGATLRDMASEASRVVLREVTDPERVKGDVAAVLMRDIERASAAAEFGDVARIADVVTKITGGRAPERHEHAVIVAQYERMPPKQRAEWLRERAATMLAEAERLDAEHE